MIDLNTHNEIIKSVNNSIISQKKIKNILITGCGGMIGSYLVSALLSKKFKPYLKIYGFDIIPPNLDKNIVYKKNFIFKKSDLTKKKNFRINKKIDLIIHLAGIPSPKYYKKYPLKTYFLNSDLCKILLDLAKIKKARFIYFSSSEIYGNPDSSNIPTPEKYEGRVSSISDRSCYDESKRSGETYSYIYKHFYSLDTKIIRPFNFYGNGMSKKDKRVIPQFFYDFLKSKIMNVYGNGNQTRTYCNIIDAIPIIIKICFFGKHFVYNVGNDTGELSAYNLANKIAKLFKEKKYKINKINYPKDYPSSEPLRRCPNIKRIKEEFSYKPKVSLKEGLNMFKEFAEKNY
tara:strand:- start:13684 stop:14718 length:1035 start_codon:yes stop_codon:yes gene_type:complete